MKEKPEYWDEWPDHIKKDWEKLVKEEVYYPGVKPRTIEELQGLDHIRFSRFMKPKPLMIIENGSRKIIQPRNDIQMESAVAPFLTIPYSSIEFVFTITPHEKKENMHIIQLIELVHIPGEKTEILPPYLARVPVTDLELTEIVQRKSDSDMLEYKLENGTIYLNRMPDKNWLSVQNNVSFCDVHEKWGWGYIMNADAQKGIVDDALSVLKFYSKKQNLINNIL